jgi:predicted dehydrogenase
LRGELICAALKAGKPVYTEKPLADSKAETMTILRAADDTGVPLCIGHNRRSGPAVLEFKRLLELARERGADRKPIIDRGSGKRRMIAEERQSNLLIRVNDDAWTWKLWAFEDEHGIMLNEMTHFVDLALWVMPAPPVEVYSCGSPRGNFVQIIRFADGSLANLLHSMVGNFDYPKERYEATARNVTISLDHYLELRQRGLDSEPQCQYFPLEQGGELTDKPGIEGFFEATDKLQE